MHSLIPYYKVYIIILLTLVSVSRGHLLGALGVIVVVGMVVVVVVVVVGVVTIGGVVTTGGSSEKTIYMYKEIKLIISVHQTWCTWSTK